MNTNRTRPEVAPSEPVTFAPLPAPCGPGIKLPESELRQLDYTYTGALADIVRSVVNCPACDGDGYMVVRARTRTRQLDGVRLVCMDCDGSGERRPADRDHRLHMLCVDLGDMIREAKAND